MTLPQRVARGEAPEPVIRLWLRIAVALTALILTFLVLYLFVASLDVPVIPKRAGLNGSGNAVADRAAPARRQIPKFCEITPPGTEPLAS